jgi:hypothetical protein
VEKQDNPACRKSEPAWQRGPKIARELVT